MFLLRNEKISIDRKTRLFKYTKKKIVKYIKVDKKKKKKKKKKKSWPGYPKHRQLNELFSCQNVNCSNKYNI